MLKYHQETFKLLGREVVIEQQAIDQLNALEKQYQIKLPASVREWYSLKAAIELMDNGDIPISITEFAAISNQIAWGMSIENGFLAVMKEPSEFRNTIHWCVRLDGSDNPPVVVQGRYPDEPWQVISPSFSEYIFALTWDRQLSTGYALHSDEAIDIRPLSDKTRQFLYSHFMPIMARCDSTRDVFQRQTFRFEHDDQHIRIDVVPEWSNQTYWRLQAASPTSLYVLGKVLWHYDSLNTRLSAGGHFDSQAVLDRLKGQWEYQLSCSCELKDRFFNQQDRHDLKKFLPQEQAWGNFANNSESYRFAVPGKQVCVAILESKGILSWRLRAESLFQLSALVQLIASWPSVLDNLMPDSYADSYQETLDLIERLRSQGASD